MSSNSIRSKIDIGGRPMAKKEYEYKLNWRTNNVKRIEFCVNIHTDGEVVEWLKCQPNKSAYIVGLIKNDIKKSNKKR